MYAFSGFGGFDIVIRLPHGVSCCDIVYRAIWIQGETVAIWLEGVRNLRGALDRITAF